ESDGGTPERSHAAADGDRARFGSAARTFLEQSAEPVGERCEVGRDAEPPVSDPIPGGGRAFSTGLDPRRHLRCVVPPRLRPPRSGTAAPVGAAVLPLSNDGSRRTGYITHQLMPALVS